MSTSKDRVLNRMRQQGRKDAQEIQNNSANMTGTELNAADDAIPEFTKTVKVTNMLDRIADQTKGFVCKTSAGRIVRLIQNYDSDIYPQEPEELEAQWRFVWSTDPKKALPFIKLATSPYAAGECCTENDHVYRSTIENNVFAPSEYSNGWEDLGLVSDIIPQ